MNKVCSTLLKAEEMLIMILFYESGYLFKVGERKIVFEQIVDVPIGN